jgi:O-antigen ligase
MAADERPAPREVSPWTLLLALSAVAVAGLAGLPAQTAAALVGLLLAVLILRQPANGLTAIVLTAPFLLGEYKTAYFWLAPILLVVLLLSALGHRYWGRLTVVPVHGVALLAFAVAGLLALPLDLSDLREDLWLFRSLEWPLILVRGVPDISHLKYLDQLRVVLFACGLFLLAAQPAGARTVVRALPALSALVAGLSAFGLLRFFGLVQTAGDYLTLSFWTWQNPDLRLTAVAWNPDYFALFLVLAVPLAAALAVGSDRPWPRGLGAAAAGLGTAALVFTFQRAAYLALVTALAVLAVLLSRRGRARVPWAPALVAVGLGLLVAGVVDAAVLHGRVVERLGRLAQDPNRLRLWQTALRMAADHPVLGVGTGRYAFFFREYAGELAQGFGPFWGTAHSLYLHLLAEQGVIGLASFLALLGSVWLGAARRLRAAAPDRLIPLAGLLAALAGWLAYSVVQFTFRVDALVYLAFILAGAAVGLAPPPPAVRPSRRWAIVAVGVGLILFVVRADAALRRPVSPGYQAGFHRWERQADGSAARWTGHRAAMTVPVRGRILELRLAAPIPDLPARPQTVRIWVDRGPAVAIQLATPDWQTVSVPVDKPGDGHVLVEMEVAYTFVPRDHPPSRDQRRLGVMVREVGWREG